MSTELEGLEPIPGDLIVALHDMRSWETEWYRGDQAPVIRVGEQGLLVAAWDVGNQRRFKLFREQRVLLFSCESHCVLKNWKVARAAPRLPTIGCP